MKKTLLLGTVFASSLLLFSCKGEQKTEVKTDYKPTFPLGEFVRPEGVNPVLSPDTSSVFFCPMNQTDVRWEESDAFNPGAVVKDGKICVLYRAEDNSSVGIGSRVSRVALAESADGFNMEKRNAPVVFPADDNNKFYEWPGGCEDPRVSVTEDGTFVIFYTSWDRKFARLCVATSNDLLTWEKHGPVFADAYDGKFLNTWSKASSILTTLKDDKLVITKINDKYFMYWGEYIIYGAYSDDLKKWTPIVDENGDLEILMAPREGYFDSDLTECGPPAILTEDGVILLYNGKNSAEKGDPNYATNAYCAGQALFDAKDPSKFIKRLDKPFLIPEADFEKSGQYPAGTVFIEGLVYFEGKWFLYYGCADSKVAVVVYDPQTK
ncbi:glycoside hydrolase family 130 protein [Bacteroidales bacterium OttesenSCG-928-I14]|nr:glycoside hydrolase family 130 protein [Bacteroidales bacterium OttesenSCG-928-I14]